MTTHTKQWQSALKSTVSVIDRLSCCCCCCTESTEIAQWKQFCWEFRCSIECSIDAGWLCLYKARPDSWKAAAAALSGSSGRFHQRLVAANLWGVSEFDKSGKEKSLVRTLSQKQLSSAQIKWWKVKLDSRLNCARQNGGSFFLSFLLVQLLLLLRLTRGYCCVG